MDTGVGDELRASGSREAAIDVKSTAVAASCVAPYVRWRSVSRGIFRAISPYVCQLSKKTPGGFKWSTLEEGSLRRFLTSSRLVVVDENSRLSRVAGKNVWPQHRHAEATPACLRRLDAVRKS